MRNSGGLKPSQIAKKLRLPITKVYRTIEYAKNLHVQDSSLQ